MKLRWSRYRKGGKRKKKRKSSYHGFEELGMKLRLPRCSKEHNHLARKTKSQLHSCLQVCQANA
jgi:hypothetical protein